MSSWYEEYQKGFKDGKASKDLEEFENYCIAHRFKILTDEAAENIKEKMCDEYCRYPIMPIPKGKTEDWLIEDSESPCLRCPINMI